MLVHLRMGLFLAITFSIDRSCTLLVWTIKEACVSSEINGKSIINASALQVQGRHSLNPQLQTYRGVDEKSLAAQSHSPRMELPPLSPGIQARVMEEVEVVETVSRGWSGGTAEETNQ